MKVCNRVMGLRIGANVGQYNEGLGSIKGGECLNQLSDH
jgi:hypothetical protein